MVYAYEIDSFKEDTHALTFWVFIQTVVLGIFVSAHPEGISEISHSATFLIALCVLVTPLWFTAMYNIRTISRLLRMWWKDHPLRVHRPTFKRWFMILGFGDLVSTITIVYLSPLLPNELPHHAINTVLSTLHLA